MDRYSGKDGRVDQPAAAVVPEQSYPKAAEAEPEPQKSHSRVPSEEEGSGMAGVGAGVAGVSRPPGPRSRPNSFYGKPQEDVTTPSTTPPVSDRRTHPRTLCQLLLTLQTHSTGLPPPIFPPLAQETHRPRLMSQYVHPTLHNIPILPVPSPVEDSSPRSGKSPLTPLTRSPKVTPTASPYSSPRSNRLGLLARSRSPPTSQHSDVHALSRPASYHGSRPGSPNRLEALLRPGSWVGVDLPKARSSVDVTTKSATRISPVISVSRLAFVVRYATPLTCQPPGSNSLHPVYSMQDVRHSSVYLPRNVSMIELAPPGNSSEGSSLPGTNSQRRVDPQLQPQPQPRNDPLPQPQHVAQPESEPLTQTVTPAMASPPSSPATRTNSRKTEDQSRSRRSSASRMSFVPNVILSLFESRPTPTRSNTTGHSPIQPGPRGTSSPPTSTSRLLKPKPRPKVRRQSSHGSRSGRSGRSSKTSRNSSRPSSPSPSPSPEDLDVTPPPQPVVRTSGTFGVRDDGSVFELLNDVAPPHGRRDRDRDVSSSPGTPGPTEGAEGFYRTRSKSNTGTVMSGGTKRVLYVKNGVDGEITEGEEELRDGAGEVEDVVLNGGVFLAESPVAALTSSPLPDDVRGSHMIRHAGHPLPELSQGVETGLKEPNAGLPSRNTPIGSNLAQDGGTGPKDAPTGIGPTSSTADEDPYRSLRPLTATPTPTLSLSPIVTTPTRIFHEDTLRLPFKRQVDQQTQTSIPTTPTATPGKRPLPIPPSRPTSLVSPTSTHTLESGLGPATSTGTLGPSHDHSTHDNTTTGLPGSEAMAPSQAARHSIQVVESSAGLAIPQAPPQFYPPGPPSHAPESSEGYVPERSTSTTPDIKLPTGALPPQDASLHASAYAHRPLPSPPNASIHSRRSRLSGSGSHSHSHAHTNHTNHTTLGTHTPVPSPTSAQPGSSTSDLPLLIASHLLSTHAASLMRHSATMRESSELMRQLARESLDWGSMLMAMANNTRGREDGSLRGPSGFGLEREPEEKAFDGSGVNRYWREGDTTRFEGLPPLPDLNRLSSMLARSAPLQDHGGQSSLNRQNQAERISRYDPDRHLRRSSLPPKSSMYPTPPTSDLFPRASRDPHPRPEPGLDSELKPQPEPDFDSWDPRNDNFTQLPDRPSFVRDGRKRKGQSLPPAWYDAHEGVSPGGANPDGMRRPTQAYGTPWEVLSSPTARENEEGPGPTIEEEEMARESERERERERKRTWSFSRSRENGWSEIATAGEEAWSLEAALRSLTPEGRCDQQPRETDSQRNHHTAAIRHPFAFAANSTLTEGFPASRGARGAVSTRGPEQVDEDDLAAFRISFTGPATMPTSSQLRLQIPNASAHGHGHGHGHGNGNEHGQGQGHGQGLGHGHGHGHGVSPSHAFPISSDVLSFGPGVACPPSPTGTPTPLETPRIGPPAGVVGLRLPSEDESEKDDVLGVGSGVVRAKSLLGQTSPTSPMRPTRPISTVSSAQTESSQGPAGGVGGGAGAGVGGGPARAGSRASNSTTARASGGRKLSKRTRPKGAGMSPGTGSAIPLLNIGLGLDGTDGTRRPRPGQGTSAVPSRGSGSVRGGPGRVWNAGGAGAPGKDVDADAKSVGTAEGEVVVKEKRHWWSRRTSVVA